MKILNYIVYLGTIAVIVLSAALILKLPKVPEFKRKSKLDSIVRLVNESGLTFCTGTVVNKNTIITAGHCIIVEFPPFGGILRDRPIEIRSLDDKKVNVYGIAYNATTQLDLGTIVGDFQKFEYRKAITNINSIVRYAIPGASFRACGYPLGGNLYCSTLYFVSTKEFQWRVQGILLPGMSGGPVMLEDGSMIGVNSAVDGEDSIISPIYNLDKFYKR
jgi:S1-C subfamily serine protease